MKKMTEYQRELVETHMCLVDQVIRKQIKVRGCVLLSYEDFYQIGCEALCRAAMVYKPNLGLFEPLAKTSIYNAILDHCRKQNRVISGAIADPEDGVSVFASIRSGEDVEQTAIDSEFLHVLEPYRERYSGVARLGVEAIRLKALGLGTREIAEKYGTTVNNVNAWMSKARARLRNESALVAAFE